VLGDTFHAMERPRVPVKHLVRKLFYVALREAFFVWCEETMELVEAQLKETGSMAVEEIKARKYYNVDWFTDRAPRFIPKPSVLYRRVCAVFETFGPQLDEKTRKPLFNDAAWIS
jgi:hypothetical protein